MLRQGFEPERDVLTSLRATGRVSYPSIAFAPYFVRRKMLRQGFEPWSLPREGNMIGRTTLTEPSSACTHS